MTLTMSATWVSRLMLGFMRCERSPSPVRVGVKTSCPALRSACALGRQHQPPIQAPWTRTKLAIVSSWTRRMRSARKRVANAAARNDRLRPRSVGAAEHHAAVDDEFGAGYECRGTGNEKQRRALDLVGRGDAVKRDGAPESLGYFGIAHVPAGDVGDERARRDRVDQDVVLGEFESRLAHKVRGAGL